jgi:hypothetical protein
VSDRSLDRGTLAVLPARGPPVGPEARPTPG